jgi:hypothetical protein
MFVCRVICIDRRDVLDSCILNLSRMLDIQQIETCHWSSHFMHFTSARTSPSFKLRQSDSPTSVTTILVFISRTPPAAFPLTIRHFRDFPLSSHPSPHFLSLPQHPLLKPHAFPLTLPLTSRYFWNLSLTSHLSPLTQFRSNILSSTCPVSSHGPRLPIFSLSLCFSSN